MWYGFNRGANLMVVLNPVYVFARTIFFSAPFLCYPVALDVTFPHHWRMTSGCDLYEILPCLFFVKFISWYAMLSWESVSITGDKVGGSRAFTFAGYHILKHYHIDAITSSIFPSFDIKSASHTVFRNRFSSIPSIYRGKESEMMNFRTFCSSAIAESIIITDVGYTVLWER